MPEKTDKILKYSLLLMMALGFLASLFLAPDFTSKTDVIFPTCYSHFLSLYVQTGLYVLTYYEVITIRHLSNEIAVRSQTKRIIVFLMRLIFCQWFLFWLSYLATFYLLGHRIFFKMGNPVFGMNLLLGHLILVLLLAWCLILAYKVPYPYLVIIIVVILTLIYHYYFEVKILLPKYNPIFDPIYRELHHIYL